MKKLAYMIPVLLIVLFSAYGGRLVVSGSLSPMVLLAVMAVVLVLSFLLRPKGGAGNAAGSAIQMVDPYAKDAFAHDAKLQSLFLGAVKDASSNCPKAAINKLQKLEPQCRDDRDRYAVSIFSAICLRQENRFEDAARAYDRALVLRPSSDLAHNAGGCYQRLGELDKAKDSYEFALELDDSNLEARSSLATVCVASGDYQSALEHAALVLEQDGNHASSLATSAIYYGLLNDSLMCKHFTDRAVENGYKRQKITDTISALKK